MTQSIALVLCLAGLGALALSMPRHHRDLLGHLPRPRRSGALQIAGWTLLGLSVAACIDGLGAAIGLVFWIGMLTLAALSLAAALSVADRIRRPGRHGDPKRQCGVEQPGS